MRLGTLVFVALIFSSPFAWAADPPASAPAPTPTPDQATKDEARSHFEQGIAHFDREEWSAALAEFLRSRELFPTRVATKNAATCLRKEKRYDESLDMFEAFLREFPDISAADKLFAQREVDDLRQYVGALNVQGAAAGTSIVVDGRNRGTAPLAGPIRVTAGTHVVRAYHDGFTPFESRVDVAGRTAAVVQVHLDALTSGGRLRVTEGNGKALDVVVDNVVVGKTPWEGAIAVGDHVVLLRGSGADANLGTQPAAAPVKINQLTPITLVSEVLAGEARIVPTPAGSSVAIDGVTVGRGLWDGRLKVGAHVIEVAAEGFLPSRRSITLEASKRAVIDVTLERDLSSPLWAKKNPPRLFFELDGAAAFVPLFGGDVLKSCSGACASDLPLGFRGVAHGGYELSSGIGFGVDVGYLRATTSATNRSAALNPVGLAANKGTASDDLAFGGLTVGLSAAYHTRDSAWPVLVRLGAGVLLGSVNDDRAGHFTNSKNAAYDIALSTSQSATYLAVTPEARLGRRLGDHWEVSIGVEVIFLAALSQPKWDVKKQALTAPAAAVGDRGDGLATFTSQSLTGSTLLGIHPGLGVRYDF